MNRKIYIIADSHLGGKEGDIAQIQQWLDTLDPNASEIICLGDFFHIWASPKKYHSIEVTEMIASMGEFRDRGGVFHLVVGNRDIFFKAGLTGLPFEEIAMDFLVLERFGKKLLFSHGDLVNSQDKQYLRWRKLVRSLPFRLFFNLLPAAKVKGIMADLEQKLQETNQAFRIEFPEEEWLAFLQKNLHKQTFDLMAIGHFHPASLKETKIDGSIGLVVPDWYESRQVLVIDEDFQYAMQPT